MKLKKVLCCSVILSTVILLMGSAAARDLLWSETGSILTGHSLSGGETDTLQLFLRDLEAIRYSPGRVSSPLDGKKNDEQAISGDGSPVPEPGVLLVLGTVLMGIALYRRYRYK